MAITKNKNLAFQRNKKKKKRARDSEAYDTTKNKKERKIKKE